MDQDYHDFIINIHNVTGINLSLYKETQMKRRLTTLRNKHGFVTFSDFFIAIKERPVLFDEFLERMTINVSEFYRNPNRWNVLQRKILPRLVKETNSLKVWSAACSSGEEPYTLALMLSDFVRLREKMILATDIDEQIMERAKNGFYLERSVQQVPEQKLKTYFQREALGYRINDEVKKSIAFKKQNLLADRFETGFDLIVCRNVMIYFTEEAKHELYQKFSQALRPGGILFVGSTEQIFQAKQYQLEADETFFYRKMS
ncbi:chemotaxis protein CheR [Alkalihalobacillus alcalophilus ATCC 27647 = CGMCC 1.3604]|uniref:protein-glutamate O-methyltransferase n=1 Tax=Alkalihalobacillus alcalophilus ATCC 27647 = CGMCC 1.3604 TaxID=1218173 RepID=A0A094WN09_ALKAL|nr:protein-glutamate O-methyltransferase CheR [Alkalihalobacillus alcalophilus]KGA99144.1 chemotaxis protein CheR [Alkalihalobacillus alcalophilus ATCC 27647 = CGMCC 1.3604]MED1560491.1 protein-glutamate O-methyltransferase CheR [Alkalihalobacillus alcalophilus]THG92030.1 chemotaxis protein CheR [Alkalihalobacillus alcalophilus ATCC 27647 = CGMCC 1.3604]